MRGSRAPRSATPSPVSAMPIADTRRTFPLSSRAWRGPPTHSIPDLVTAQEARHGEYPPTTLQALGGADSRTGYAAVFCQPWGADHLLRAAPLCAVVGTHPDVGR